MARYGLFGSFTAHPGKRDELLDVLREGALLVKDAPGCEVYVVNLSPDDPDKIWIYEAWLSEVDHNASLELPGIREVINRALPLIAGMGDRVVLEPIVGKGLSG